MAEITSNFFTLQTEEDKFKHDDFISITNRHLEPKTETITNELFTSANALLNNCNGYENVNFQEIVLNNENFSDNHYALMGNRHIIVFHNKLTGTYKYLTPSGKVFIVSEPNLISIIHRSPIPRKISIGYIPRIDSEIIISFKLICQVIYNLNTQNTSSLISKFLKTNIKVDNSSEYTLAYYIFNIYPKLESIIDKKGYWKYIFLEQNIFNIANETRISLNADIIENLKKSSTANVMDFAHRYSIDTTVFNSKIKTLHYINDNTDFYPSLNSTTASLIDEEELKFLVKDINTLNLINSIKNNTYPMPNTNSPYGNIPKGIDINVNLSDKVLLKGTYSDLFFKIFVGVTHSKKYVPLCLENTLISELLKGKVDDELLKLYSLYTENYIKAKLLGHATDEQIINYFIEELDTLLSEDDLETIKYTYEEYLKDIDEIILNRNDSISNPIPPKLLNHSKLGYLALAIIEKERLITKNLINEIWQYCNDFNKKNKSKINIVYFKNDSIYLLADKQAFNTAFDTLTRIMPAIFSKYCPLVSPTCKIELIE